MFKDQGGDLSLRQANSASEFAASTSVGGSVAAMQVEVSSSVLLIQISNLFYFIVPQFQFALSCNHRLDAGMQGTPLLTSISPQRDRLLSDQHDA